MTATREISKFDDIIDSRDVIARIEELESVIADAVQELEDSQDETDKVDTVTCGGCGLSWNDAAVSGTTPAPAGRCPFEYVHQEAAELKTLKALAEEADGYAADWKYGEALIRDSYFETYAQELAEEIGAINRNASWPLMHIDWTAAADALKQDYTCVDFDGVDYWIR